MRWLNYFCLSFLFAVILLHSRCQVHVEPQLRIATASNMQYALTEIATSFTEKTGIKAELIIGSSGKLTAQIMEGAPYDLLVSADMKYPHELHKQGLTNRKPQVYALGKLVLWSMNQDPISSLRALTHEDIEHIATANPMTAPYGRAADEIMQQLDFHEEIKDKLVFGESISQVNQFIVSQSAEIGFTSLSTVKSQQASGKGSWLELDSTLYQPIQQGAALIKHGNETNQYALEFYTFLFSPEAKTILKDFGYSIYE